MTKKDILREVTMNEVDKRFNKQFGGFISLGTKEGGYDARPYILDFIHEEIRNALNSVVPEKADEMSASEGVKTVKLSNNVWSRLSGSHKPTWIAAEIYNSAIDQINSNIKKYLE